MKEYLNNIKQYMNDENNPKRKPIFFFGFYLIFFLILFGIIIFSGDKDYLNKEYDIGGSLDNNGNFCYNCIFDYKVTIDGVLHDYYGKRMENVSSFKYNNLDYYFDQDEYFVKKDLWIKSDNPYYFSEFLDYDNIYLLVKQATLIDALEEDDKIIFHYLISSNTINQLLYNENTDYDEEADSLDMVVDVSDNIEKITYKLDHFCMHRDNCNNTLMIEMNFEMFGSVTKIDNPIE